MRQTVLEAASRWRVLYHPGLTGSPIGADPMDRMLGALRSICREPGHVGAVAELCAATESFARHLRLLNMPPELVVLSLKELFVRVDGRRPSLSHAEDDASPSGSACLHWYPHTFEWCLRAYFAGDSGAFG